MTAPPGRAREPSAVVPEKHQALLHEHCVSCHGPEKQKGKFRVDDLPLTITDNRNAERWQKVLNALNSGEMPPEEEKQPVANAKADFLEDLARAMVVARRNLADTQGVITMRRLNQREYGNTLRELLGVTIAVGELPADKNTAGFDTASSSLFMSGDQFEQYVELGRDAVTEAFARHDHSGLAKKVRFEAEKGLLERVNKSLNQRIEARLAYLRAQHGLHDAAGEIYLQPLLRHLGAEFRHNEREGGFKAHEHHAQHQRGGPQLTKGANDQAAVHRRASGLCW